MKKFVLIFVIIFLSFCSVISFVFTIKYKKQIKVLNIEINRLNNAITEISSGDSKLANDKTFVQKQYQDSKSTENEIELIGLEIQKCMKSCNYTTTCMNNCTYKAIPEWEKEIDKNIKLLEKIMNKEQIELLHDSQAKWTIYKDVQQKLNSETIGTMTGTMYTNILATDQAHLIKLRAKELDGLYYILSQK